MPRVGFERTILVFERAKTVQALGGVATVIGMLPLQEHNSYNDEYDWLNRHLGRVLLHTDHGSIFRHRWRWTPHFRKWRYKVKGRSVCCGIRKQGQWHPCKDAFVRPLVKNRHDITLCVGVVQNIPGDGRTGCIRETGSSEVHETPVPQFARCNGNCYNRLRWTGRHTYCRGWFICTCARVRGPYNPHAVSNYVRDSRELHLFAHSKNSDFFILLTASVV
jgi:hypothetical protein